MGKIVKNERTYEPGKKIIQAAVVDAIKQQNNVTYAEISRSIQVHPTHIHRVSKGLKTLSQEKFSQLCDQWDIQVNDLLEQFDMVEMARARRRTLVKLLNSRKIDLGALSKKTGISFLDINKIQRGKRDATDKELELIAVAIGLDALILKEGRIAVVLNMIDKLLDHIYFDPSAKEAVMRYIDAEL